MPFSKTLPKLFYKQFGQGEDLILISGFTANHLGFELLAKALSPYYRVTIFDNRSVGQSDIPSPGFKVADMADDVAKLMDDLNIHQAHIFGASMGGAILQSFLLQHPHRVKKAMIAVSFAKLPAKSITLVDFIHQLMLDNYSAEFIYHLWMPWCYSNAFFTDPKRVAAMVSLASANPYPQTLLGFQGQLHALKNFDASNDIQKINSEVLIIAGDDDVLTPPACSQFIHEQIANSKLVVLQGAAHCMHTEHTDLLANTMLQYLQSHAAYTPV